MSKKPKPTAKQRQLQADWQALVDRHKQWPKFCQGQPPSLPEPAKAEPPMARSATYTPHGGTAKPDQQYTGTSILGIGTMHKSNAVPVFSQEQAEDIARMRRN